ncbi:MAG: winged helix-turn-helix transcriptional regulator [Candidatus Woesearchaeota archaeon]|nr:MAG: winged helix-turn-helix transcriptional regulator [Candidatus Woesearchaeota archaeon]
MVKSPKKEFIELVCEINKSKGLDELSSKIIGILFIEPREISLDEISKRTGYSLSAVSTSMKFLSKSDLIRRVKKPGSKKIYFYMEKDMIDSFLTVIGKTGQKVISLAKSRVPSIIDKYNLEKSKTASEELKILKNYYKQLLVMEEMMNKFTKMLEEAHSKLGDTK